MCVYIYTIDVFKTNKNNISPCFDLQNHPCFTALSAAASISSAFCRAAASSAKVQRQVLRPAVRHRRSVKHLG